MSIAQEIINGDVPWDVSDWIVEFQHEIDERGVHLTPTQIFQIALTELKRNPVALVTHVRSGLTWDVRFRDGKLEAIEVVCHSWKGDHFEPNQAP